MRKLSYKKAIGSVELQPVKTYTDVSMGHINLACDVVKALMQGVTDAPNEADKRSCKIALNLITAEINSSEV